MNYAFLPDLSALAILIAVLLVLRRRHPQEGADVWLLGLGFTLVEAVAHTFYSPFGLPASVLHVTVLDCYLLAGLTFTWASADEHLSRRSRLLYLVLNALPLLALDTLYGLHLSSPTVYRPAILAGMLLGVASSLTLRRSWRLAAGYLLGWTAIAILVQRADLRAAVYWSLCCVYLIAGLNFARRLPPRSTGRIAIVTGFFTWSLCFLLHPWIVHYREYADIASHVWNMQKSLISIGMLLVMLERQLAHSEWLALHDDLTGLPNRRLFEERLATALRQSREAKTRLVLLLLDLNGFKKINDSLGHQAGDEVLRAVAESLRSAIPSAGTLARLGGDEFVLIVPGLERHPHPTPDLDAAGLDHLGEASLDHLGAARPAHLDDPGRDHLIAAMHAAVAQPLLAAGQSVAVSASLGLAIYPDDAEDATRLLNLADQRMYAGKQAPAIVPSSRNAAIQPRTAPESVPAATSKGVLIATEAHAAKIHAAEVAEEPHTTEPHAARAAGLGRPLPPPAAYDPAREHAPRNRSPYL